jgi:hypothetical protein
MNVGKVSGECPPKLNLALKILGQVITLSICRIGMPIIVGFSDRKESAAFSRLGTEATDFLTRHAIRKQLNATNHRKEAIISIRNSYSAFES